MPGQILATPNRVNVKEQLYIDGLLQGKSSNQSALDAGYSKSYSMQSSAQLYTQPRIQAALNASFAQLGTGLAAAGITVQAICEPVVLGLQATRRICTTPGRVKDKKYEDVPDINIRLKAAQLAWKMLQDVRHARQEVHNPIRQARSLDKLQGMDEIQLASELFDSK